MPDDVATSPVTLEEYAALSMPDRRKLWIEISDMTEEEFDQLQAEEKAREAIVPKIGSEAPDFVADLLDRERKRTGETVRLSDLGGKPVGLVFGSYT